MLPPLPWPYHPLVCKVPASLWGSLPSHSSPLGMGTSLAAHTPPWPLAVALHVQHTPTSLPNIYKHLRPERSKTQRALPVPSNYLLQLPPPPSQLTSCSDRYPGVLPPTYPMPSVWNHHSLPVPEYVALSSPLCYPPHCSLHPEAARGGPALAQTPSGSYHHPIGLVLLSATGPKGADHL